MARLVVVGWVAVLLAGCAESKVPCTGSECAVGVDGAPAEPDAQVPCGGTCGDGLRCGGEACDDGYNDACGSCNADCSGPGAGASCGDSTICPELEVCDDGYADACGSCNADCSGGGTVTTCGDGVFCPEFESCDDGYTDACGNCNGSCTAGGTGAICGDAVICPELESCDIGPDLCNQCAADCRSAGGGAVCGDSKWCQASEQCEDGNTTNGDGCSSLCALECTPGDISGTATASTVSADGMPSGVTTYGPQKMNDGHYEAECGTYYFHWINAGTAPGTGLVQYSWPGAVSVRRISIDTQAQASAACSLAGRNLRGATVQYWNGAAWVTAGTVSNQTDDWSFTFPSTVTTTSIRLYGVHAGSYGNPMIFEWDVFDCP